jgi:hypothetical protein
VQQWCILAAIDSRSRIVRVPDTEGHAGINQNAAALASGRRTNDLLMVRWSKPDFLTHVAAAVLENISFGVCSWSDIGHECFQGHQSVLENIVSLPWLTQDVVITQQVRSLELATQRRGSSSIEIVIHTVCSNDYMAYIQRLGAIPGRSTARSSYADCPLRAQSTALPMYDKARRC